jgi:hypothetical protein
MLDWTTGSFSCVEETVLGTVYLDMLELFLVPQVKELQPFIFQQDGASSHWSLATGNFKTNIF